MSLRLAAVLFTWLLPLFLLGEEAQVIRELLFEPTDPNRERDVPVKVYFNPSASPQPIVLFSHGLGGSRDNNAYLGKHWANHGYVAVFMQHAGSDSEVWRSVPLLERMSALKKAASLESSLARFADVPFVIDQLEIWNAEEGHPLQGKLNLEKIGMSGHSYGAVTTQAMMGQKYPIDRTFHEPRIDAFLAFSPSIQKRMVPEDTFGHISFPVLLMTGTKDGSPIDPSTTPESRMQVYTAMPEGDKYHLVFQDAHHFAFGDSERRNTRGRKPHHHPAIQTVSTRFWDAYLKEDDSAKVWLQSEKPRSDCELAEKDVWEWK